MRQTASYQCPTCKRSFAGYSTMLAHLGEHISREYRLQGKATTLVEEGVLASPAVRSMSIESVIQAAIVNGIKDLKIQVYREISELFQSLARGQTIPTEVQQWRPVLRHGGHLPERRVLTLHKKHVPTPVQKPKPKPTRTQIILRKREHSVSHWASISKQMHKTVQRVFASTCLGCQKIVKTQATLETETMHRSNASNSARFKAFLTFAATHEPDETRRVWHFLCKGCASLTPHGAMPTWIGRQNARRLARKVLGEKCRTCGRDPIRPLGSVILQGPGKTSDEKIRNFSEVFFTQGEQKAKELFWIDCRTCISRTERGLGRIKAA